MKSPRAIYLFLFIVVIVPVTVFGITKWYDLNIKKLPVFGPENHVVGDFRSVSYTHLTLPTILRV